MVFLFQSQSGLRVFTFTLQTATNYISFSVLIYHCSFQFILKNRHKFVLTRSNIKIMLPSQPATSRSCLTIHHLGRHVALKQAQQTNLYLIIVQYFGKCISKARNFHSSWNAFQHQQPRPMLQATPPKTILHAPRSNDIYSSTRPISPDPSWQMSSRRDARRMVRYAFMMNFYVNLVTQNNYDRLYFPSYLF